MFPHLAGTYGPDLRGMPDGDYAELIAYVQMRDEELKRAAAYASAKGMANG